MSRILTPYADHHIVKFLDLIAQSSTDATAYQNAMLVLGQGIGTAIANQISTDEAISLACTVEDADYLAKGIIDTLKKKTSRIALTCFWNDRRSNGSEMPDTAPIIKRYREPDLYSSTTLVVVKAVISSACVVKTNLTNMINEGEFKQIFVAAPVIHNQAISNLQNEFPNNISDCFKYIYFAVDSEKNTSGEIVPGIGGNLYTRLGFKNQQDKNKYIPNLIKQRRALSTH